MVSRVLLATSVRWPSAARIAAAFATSGARVDALFPRGHVLGESRYVEKAFAYSPLSPGAALRTAIARSEPDVIVPCDDRMVRQMLDLHAREKDSPVARTIERSLGDLKNYPALLSRQGFIEAAKTCGIAAPKSVALNSDSDLEAAIASLGFPFVIKSDGSWGGDGVAVVRTREDARMAYRRMSVSPSRVRSLARAARRGDAHFLRDAVSPPRASLSAQAFISGTAATTAFAAWNGKVLAAIHMDVVQTDGATGPACVLRRVNDTAMAEAADRLARKFHLSGLHGLDFMRDANGTVHLIEINPRATQTSHLAFGDGADLAAALTGAMGGRPVRARHAIANDTVALFPQAWRADPANPALQSGYHDVPWDDPGVLRACVGTAPAPAAPNAGTSAVSAAKASLPGAIC